MHYGMAPKKGVITLKCKQIYIHQTNGTYNVKLHTWTRDDNTKEDYQNTLSIEPVTSTNILFLAKLQAAIASKKYNCTYPCNYAIIKE